MYYSLLAIASVLCLFAGILVFLYLGRQYALWQKSHSKIIKSQQVSISESAVFALLGLIIALTFISAAQKFDNRRELIIQEANAIGTAYMRLDLLETPYRTSLKKDMQEYLDLRIKTYKYILIDIDEAMLMVKKSYALQSKIWNTAITACPLKSPSYCILILPSLNEMFDLANTRVSHTKVHPHRFIFVFLIIVVLISALMAGYRMSNYPLVRSIHILSFAFVFTITIYTIIDMEYPRLGLIRLDDFDEVLLNLQLNLQNK